MTTQPKAPISTRALKDRLARASGATQPLVDALVDRTCPRYPNMHGLPGFTRLRNLMAAGAWIDAALALLELRLPRWQVRQLYHEDGEWHCVLALRWTPAASLTRVVVAKHPALELAVMSAYLEAVERAPDLERPLANVVPLQRGRREAATFDAIPLGR